ncbi:MAG: radical SAM protein [Myxococcota bacterium]
MLTEEQRAEADGGGWTTPVAEAHEAAAHQKRNWVRLTFECNDRCIFCLDSDAHDGRMRDPQEVKAQILDGRRKGAERLILSDGEPTIHPRYADFIRLGRLAGYDRIQTVTNGRMFKYRPFLTRCLDEGLQEITFSIHGPNARIHDALVGVKGAYDEEIEGLRNAFEDGRPIINVDICVNRGNVKQLPAMIEGLYAMGVREFDLLHVIPFGNAWRDGKDVLFYDLDAMQPVLTEAFSWAHKPGVHLWLNRFPVRHLEGFHGLIQDPYKLNDEIRGRKEEFANWVSTGEPLDCREPRRCGHCYLNHVCDTFEAVQQELLEPSFDRLRIDANLEMRLPPVYGGDPASKKKKRRLPMAQLSYPPLPEQVRRANANVLRVAADTIAQARGAVAHFEGDGGAFETLELELRAPITDVAELDPLLERLSLVDVVEAADAKALLGLATSLRVGLALTKDSAPWLLDLREAPKGLELYQPAYERVSEAVARDVDLQTFFAEFTLPVAVRGVPRCVAGGRVVDEVPTLDGAMLEANGRLEAFRFIRRYIDAEYRTKSLRCRECVEYEGCSGVHINQVRAHGFAMMVPLAPSDGA